MMKSTTTLLTIFLLAPLSVGAAADPGITLRFDTPARTFHESLPLGNGRIGAMVCGGVDEERIVLNESSMWSGAHGDVEDRVWSELKHL
jgi:alpha-L-fucosidase 2